MSKVRHFVTIVPFQNLGVFFDTGTKLELIRENAHSIEGYLLFKQPKVDSNGRKCCGTICFSSECVRELLKGKKKK